jgi:hypothetical protein
MGGGVERRARAGCETVSARASEFAARLPATPVAVRAVRAVRTAPWLLAPHVTLLTGAVALWAFSLSRVRLDDIAGRGLIDVLPPTYYLAFAGLLIGFAVAMQRDPPPSLLLWAYVLAFVGLLHATAPLLYDEPRFAWTYKHLGVIDLIATTGAIDRQVDIYNNWPGFFALNAWLSTVGGVAPIAYAGWTPLLLNVLDVLVVRFALRGLTGDSRLLWTATWIFVVGNWNGGDYLAPQAFGFALGVTTVGICLRCARSPRRGLRRSADDPRPAPRWPGRRLRTRLRSGWATLSPAPPPPAGTRISRRAGLGLGGVCFLAIVVSHQLSPVMVTAAAAGLAVMVRIVPLWVPVVMAAVETWWIVLALPFLSGKFDLLAFDPLARPPTGAVEAPGLPGLALHGLTLRGLFAVIALLAAIGAIRRRRAGHRDLAVYVLVIAPVAPVLIQPYGGEATFRAYLFALPWLSFLAAAACRPAPARGGIARRATALPLVVATATIAGLMLFVFFGLELMNRIDRADVAAARWYERHAPARSTAVYIAPNFPGRLSFRYATLYPATGPPSPVLTDEPGVAGHAPGPGVTRVIARLFRLSGKSRGFVILSPSEARFARLYGLLPDGSSERVARTLSNDPAYRLVYRNGAARIFAYRRPARPPREAARRKGTR